MQIDLDLGESCNVRPQDQAQAQVYCKDMALLLSSTLMYIMVAGALNQYLDVKLSLELRHNIEVFHSLLLLRPSRYLNSS